MDAWKWTQDQWRLDLWLASMKDLHKYMLLAFDEGPNKCKEGLTTNAPMFHKNNHIKCLFKIQSLIISGVTGKRRTFFSKLGYGLDFWLVALSAKDVGSVSL